MLIPLSRSNEIWRLSIKVEVAFRAFPRNREVCRMVAQRAEFVQAEVGAKFDELRKHLIKESADLSTIDSTARLRWMSDMFSSGMLIFTSGSQKHGTDCSMTS